MTSPRVWPPGERCEPPRAHRLIRWHECAGCWVLSYMCPACYKHLKAWPEKLRTWLRPAPPRS